MKIQSRLAILTIIPFLLPAAFSQVRRSSPRRVAAPFVKHVKFYEETPYITKVVLRNGMTILVDEYRDEPVVSVQAYIQAGYLSEPPENPGVSLMLGAMIHRGKPDKVQGTLLQRVQALGGSWNYSIGGNNARFEMVAPSAQWKKALSIQADALLNPSFDPEAIKLESRLLLDRSQQALDRTAEFADEKLFELAFSSRTAAKWDRIANGGLSKITPQSLAAFYKARYAPSGMLLVISGDVNSGEVLNEAAEIYDRPSPEFRRASPADSNSKEFRYKAIRGDVQVPRVLFGFHTPAPASEDYPALEVMRAILGTGEGSVIATRLRDRKKLVLAEKTELVDFPDSSFLRIILNVEPGNIDRSELALITELELLKRKGPGKAQMERAFAQLEYEHWSSLGSVTGRAQVLARCELRGGWKKMDSYVDGIRKVKPSDVKRVANRYFGLENCSILEYLPVSVERDLDSGTVRKTIESLLKPFADREQAEREKETVLALDIPARDDSFKFSEIRYSFRTASILRGPDMFIREDHTAPLINMGIFFPGGRLSETKQNAGITELMTRLVARGSEEDAAHFNRQLEIYGGRIRPVVADDYFGFYFTVLSRNFEAAFKLLEQAIRKPVFDKEAIQRLKDIQLSDIRCRKNSGDYPLDVMNGALFGDFSYSLDAGGSEASLSAIDADSLQSWYNSHVKNRKPLVVAIGDSEGTSLAANFVHTFSGSRIKEAELPDGFVKPLGKGRTIEKDWNRNTSLILIGFQAPPANDDDWYGMTVLQSYAGGQGMLLQDLRDQSGTAFDVRFDYKPRLRGGSLVVSAAVNPANEKAALEALQEVLPRIASGPISYRDYRSAVNEAVGSSWIRRQDRLAEIEDVAISILAGKEIDRYQAIPSDLKSVRQDEFGEIAQKFLRMEKAVILRLHGKSFPKADSGR